MIALRCDPEFWRQNKKKIALSCRRAGSRAVFCRRYACQQLLRFRFKVHTPGSPNLVPHPFCVERFNRFQGGIRLYFGIMD